MKKALLRIVTVAFLICVTNIFSLSVFAANTPFIDDYAGYLTEGQMSELQQKAQELSDETDFNIGIVLTEDIEGKTPTAYADDIYDNRFGINTDGFLLLINNDTKEDWISTSGNGILYYSDNRIDSIHNSSKQYLIDGQYYQAVSTYLDNFKYYYEKGIPSSNEGYYVNTDNGTLEKNRGVTAKSVGMATLVAIITILITVFIIVRRYKFHDNTLANAYLDRNESELRVKTDTFVREYTTSVHIESSSGGGGGSSTHMSSGGGTHGGGGSSR